MSIIKMKAWIEDSYWAWRNACYFRFDSYENNLDRCSFFEELNLGWLQMYSDFYNEDLWNLRGRDQYYSLVLGDDDDNELDQIYSNTITFEWDENDPVASVLNTWTEQNFMDAILNYCKEIMSEEEYNKIEIISEEEYNKIIEEHKEESCNQNENESKTQS